MKKLILIVAFILFILALNMQASLYLEPQTQAPVEQTQTEQLP